MKIFKHKYVFLALALLFILPLLFVGCKGSDGSDGANGTNGQNGAPGTNGSPGSPGADGTDGTNGTNGTNASTFGTHNLLQGAVDIGVTITAVTNVGGAAKVDFHVATKTGNTPVTTLADSNLSVKIADLVPAGAGDNIYSTDYYEMWVSETPGKAAAVATSSTYTTPATNSLDKTDKTNGNYSYTFVTPFGSAWPGYNNAGYAAANKKRVAIELSSPPTGYNKAVGILDFNGDPGVGNTATAINSLRQFVTIAACQKCHGPYMDNAAHANSRNDMRECVFCHSALYGSAPRHATGFMVPDNADLPVFIHGIHGSTWTDTNFDPTNEEFAAGPTVEFPVTYPQKIQKCDVCHSDPSGSAPGDLTGLNNWKTNPTGRVCHSCHTSNIITAATTTIAATFTHDQTLGFAGMPVPAKTDATCTTCHLGVATPGDKADIVNAHDTTLPKFVAPATGLVSSLSTSDSPEYNVVVTMSTPSNGTYFVTGETPTVTITLTNNDAANTTVAGTLVTSGSHTVGYYDPTSLSVANMYVYGPRNSPRPSFLPSGRTDKGVAASAKVINLMTTYTSASRTSGVLPTGPFTYVDPNKTTTATGWTYQLAPIPSGTLAGTYFVRVYLGNTYTLNIADPDPNQVVSVGLVKFQVGTATEDKRIAGNANGTSSCLNCHGSEVMHRGDHAAVFDPDHCNACHYVGARGNSTIGASASTAPTSNRVHAVHDASATGDISNINWSGPNEWNVQVGPSGSFPTSTITYPANIERCIICHSSGNTAYKSNLYEIPCYGCHADSTGAGLHMSEMGGNLNSIVSGTTGTVTVSESCVVCHGAGRDADISD